MPRLTIPLFPLNSVLFPGGLLPLRIFESRYIDMVGQCMREDLSFGVCLIQDGQEVGEAASTHEVGTLARIEDWNQDSQGLLNIMVRGGDRFSIVERWVEDNRLSRAKVRLLETAAPAPLPRGYEPLAEMLKKVLAQVDLPYGQDNPGLQDAYWVSGRLAELLPLPLQQKQFLLELDTPLERLRILSEALSA